MPAPDSCPCLHTTPCHPDCTCVKPYMSRGCRRCCGFGNKEQQRAQAEWLVSQEAELVRLRPLADAALAYVKAADAGPFGVMCAMYESLKEAAKAAEGIGTQVEK